MAPPPPHGSSPAITGPLRRRSPPERLRPAPPQPVPRRLNSDSPPRAQQSQPPNPNPSSPRRSSLALLPRLQPRRCAPEHNTAANPRRGVRLLSQSRGRQRPSPTKLIPPPVAEAMAPPFVGGHHISSAGSPNPPSRFAADHDAATNPSIGFGSGAGAIPPLPRLRLRLLIVCGSLLKLLGFPMMWRFGDGAAMVDYPTPLPHPGLRTPGFPGPVVCW